jgi:cellulose synthase/poly-beta-1,6-N-acetylglucosamine synthase-like glycosyltransferase
MATDIWVIIFWVSLAGVFYTYIGYPIFLIIAARFFKKPVNKKEIYPPVSLLVVANNEDWVIRQKVENSLACNYPGDQLKVVIASDGSDDNTNDIVREYQDRGVKLFVYPERKGKMEAINRTVPLLAGEIVVFSDAREMFHPDAVRELAANFNDEKIGAVSGEYIFTAPQARGVGKSLQLYWEYEKRLRKREGEISSSVGASGAIYAIRKRLFKPVPWVTILDDLAIPMTIIAQGYRVVFDRLAKAYDDVSSTSGQEYGRKSRTLAGNFQILFNLGRKYRFRNWFVLFEYFSHKVMRMALPVFFLAFFISTVWLKGMMPRLLLAAQAVFFGLAVIGLLLEKLGIKTHFLFHAPGVFCTIHWAIVTGVFRYLIHRQSIKWQRMIKGRYLKK